MNQGDDRVFGFANITDSTSCCLVGWKFICDQEKSIQGGFFGEIFWVESGSGPSFLRRDFSSRDVQVRNLAGKKFQPVISGSICKDDRVSV